MMINAANINIGNFFPKIYTIVNIIENSDGYEFWLISRSTSGTCYKCNKVSRREHSHQLRLDVRDLPILGKPVKLSIDQAKYFCDNPECDVEIFTESSELINPYTRFTTRCRKYILSLATHVSAETAAKILAIQGIKVSGDTLLNMVKKAGDIFEYSMPKKIGVDDWSYRKGQTYGTIICDLDTHEVIDVLEGRDSETLEKWLKNHPGIEIVSRDRASSYSSAVNNVVPEAVQIADRFHISQNLITALNDALKEVAPQKIEIPNIGGNETEPKNERHERPPSENIKKKPRNGKA